VAQVSDTVDALPRGQAKAAVDRVQSSLNSFTDFTPSIDGESVAYHVVPLAFPRHDDQTLAVYVTARRLVGVLGGSTAARVIVIRQATRWPC
jgi:hypothetical protein